MIKIVTINKLWSNKLIWLILGLVATLIFSSHVYAEDASSEAMVKKHGITFPIAELGNCANYQECKAFCQIETNQDACKSFAQKKGLTQQTNISRPDESKIKAAAKLELGCDSLDSCKALCEKAENHDKCSKFAQSHGLGGGGGNVGNTSILQKAKEILGCDSEVSCKAICEKAENRQKCSDFAKQAGLLGGVRKVGPGGCTSEESCRSFCQSHQTECQNFRGEQGQVQNKTGEHQPGQNQDLKLNQSSSSGINRETFCKQNPDKCRGYIQPGQHETSGSANTFRPSADQKPSETIKHPEGVKGISTQHNLLDQLQDWLSHLIGK